MEKRKYEHNEKFETKRSLRKRIKELELEVKYLQGIIEAISKNG